MTEQLSATGPTATTARALGPDLARGAMLLFIALANSHYFLEGRTYRGGYPLDGSGPDHAVTWFIATFVDGRAFPLFGLLFGYGVARIVQRQQARGPRQVRRLLWRRSAVLVVVGFCHAVLLYAGDILTAYGVLLVLGAWTVRWKDRWLLVVAGLFLLATSLPSGDSSTLATDPPDAFMLPRDLLTMLTDRPAASLFVGSLGWLGFVTPFLVGLWAGRRRVLEQPERYRSLLGWTAGTGITAAVLGAQPVAWVLAGWAEAPARAVAEVVGPLHDGTGVLGGFGYAAALALLAARWQRRPGTVVTAIAAAGQRSMTCYLSQSVVWTLLFTPFLLGLSDDLSVAATAGLATLTWLATVLLADRLRRAGNRGPFEVLIRRVTYAR